jgi:N-acetylglucosamine-6-sulfatase
MPDRRGIAAGFLCAFLLAAGLSTVSLSGGESAVARAKAQELPNIVVVMTDDQDVPSVDIAMPKVQEKIADSGTTFSDYVVTTPKCCPARASYLTGQYGHNSGVLENNPGYEALKQHRSVLPAWLQSAGYRTAHVGKFLNGYDRRGGTKKGLKPAPGYDKWFAMLRPYRYYDYDITVGGEEIHYGRSKKDYSTGILTKYAKQFVDHSAPRKRPFFLDLSYWAPHGERTQAKLTGECNGSSIPAPKDLHAFGDEEAPEPPSFDEADVSDKPPWISNLPRMDSSDRATIERDYRCRLAALVDVDRGVSQIYKRIKHAGDLSNTIFIVTSDNGFFQGEHRIVKGKGLPYEEAIKVPMIINVPARFGGDAASESVGKPVASIDVAPTILDFARADPCRKSGKCRVLDGRSMMPLIKGQTGEWPADRGITIESNDASHTPCGYISIRTTQYLYAKYDELPGTGGTCGPASDRQEELYDLGADPFELENLHPHPAVERRLESRLKALRNCSGTGGDDPTDGSGEPCE